MGLSPPKGVRYDEQDEIDQLTTMRSLQPEPLSSYIVVKPRRNRGRSSKTPRLPELPPKALDENKPAITPSSSHSPHHVEAPSTPHSEHNHGPWEPSNSLDSDIVHTPIMPRGGRKGFSPATLVTPTHEGGNSGMSRMPRSRPSSSNTKMGDNSRENIAPVSWAQKSSLNPTQKPFQPRMPPQDARLTMGQYTPPSHGRMQRQRSAQKMNPFYEQRSTPTRSQDAFRSYNSPNTHQQSAYGGHGNELVPYQPSMHTQNPYYQHDPYAHQSTYHQYPAQDESAHAQTPYLQQPSFGSEDPFYEQQAISEQPRSHPRPAVRMPPPAVKGTPTYDSRLALLQSMTNDQEMRNFYNSNTQYQQQVLDHNFGPQQTLTANQRSPSKNIPQGLIAHAHARRESEKYAAATSPIRDPAPYTGFGAEERKKDKMLQSLDEVLETSKGQGNLSGASRTVLHDPVAHASAQKASLQLTEPTIKASPPPPQQPTVLTQLGTDRDLGLATLRPLQEPAPLKPNPITYAFGPNAFPTPSNIHTPPKYRDAAFDNPVQPATAKSEHEGPNDYNPFADIIELIEGNFTARPKRSNLFSTPDAIKYTATGLPIPHGGFGDFTTPYSVNFFGEPKDFHPGNNFSEAPGNAFIHQLAQQVSTRSKSEQLSVGVEWFHSTDRFYDIRLVTRDLAIRADAIHLEGGSHQAQTPASYTTPQAKPLPKPIGHERSSASKSSGGNQSNPTTTPNRTDLMKNPSATDANDLMSGALANLMRYADGSQVGDPFTRWGRPSEWAIDNSTHGNKSFFGGGFEAAPLRVARDPRYQQTMTSDGRPTYFEDPARGKGRGWGM